MALTYVRAMNSVLLKNKNRGIQYHPMHQTGVFMLWKEEILYCWWYVGLIYETSVSQRQSSLRKLHIWHYVAEQDRQELAGQEGVGRTPAQMWLSAAEGNPLTLVLGLQTCGTCRGNLTLASDKDFNAGT